MLELKHSALGSGGFYPITCGCGNPGCAGIFEPILVQHSKLAVTWECDSRYYPYVQQGDDAQVRILRYTFSRAQYVGAIRSAFEQLRDHPRRQSTSIGPYGFDADLLDEPFPDASEPLLPFERGATLIVGYAGPYSQPWVWLDGRPEEQSRKLLPTAQLWGDFGQWAAMWEASIEYGLCVWKKDGQPFPLAEHATLDDSNRHAKALAERLAHFWVGAAKIAWEELIADGPTGENRPGKVVRSLG